MFIDRECTNPECEDGLIPYEGEGDGSRENAGAECPTCYGTGTESVKVGDYCDVCGRSITWGCGHEPHQEAEARKHNESEEHLSGACWHFDHSECSPTDCAERAAVTHWTPPSGYAPLVKHKDARAFFAK